MTREQRRLAAIVCADVVGYSRLIGTDEVGTLARLRALRQELVDPSLAAHGGRIVKTTGDGLLIEFGSVVDAVRSAVAVQQAMARRDTALPEDRRIALRIGVHMGDIVIDGDDILGDGVNVAARLEALAEPGGVCVSGRVQEDLAGKVDLDLRDGGDQALKNIVRPVRVWHWSPVDTTAAQATTTATPTGDAPLALPDKPSIAVLPFQNMSGDPEQEYFVDGLVEDIITALSRDRGLFVIARNSSFTYKGRAVDIRQVGHELGVRYVLEGSVRKAAGRLRITAQLIDAETSAHLWADRFDGAVEDVFDLQDSVSAKVMAALAPSVERAEMDRSTRKSANLQTYDFFLRALAAYYKMTVQSIDNAQSFLKQSLALDAIFARSHALLAATYTARVANSWSNDISADSDAAERSARTAMELDDNDAFVLTQYGHVLAQLFFRREEARVLYDRAIEINPNFAVAWALRGMCQGNLGNTAQSICDLEQALRLSPRDAFRWLPQHALAWGHLMAGRYGEAVSWATAVLQRHPHMGVTLRVLIAAHGYAGQLDKAHEALATHMSIEPDARLSTLRASYLRRVSPQAFENLADGLRLAGFPE